MRDVHQEVVGVGVQVGRLTPSSSRDSRRWRGITFTSSISQRNATSVGRRPGRRGSAIVDVLSSLRSLGEKTVGIWTCVVVDLELPLDAS